MGKDGLLGRPCDGDRDANELGHDRPGAVGRLLNDGDAQRHIDLAGAAGGPDMTRPSTPTLITMLPADRAHSRAVRTKLP